MRTVLLALSRSRRLRHLVTTRPAARAVAQRFVAGETADDLLRVARELAARGRTVTADHLGEDVHDEAQARRAAAAYVELLDRLDAEGVRTVTSVSVKLTGFGIDVSEALCRELLGTICDRARRGGRDVTVDMESSAYTERTVTTVVALRRAGVDNLGCALQAYLRRTPRDLERLLEVGTSVRLCKGAYAEPASIAYRSRAEVRRRFLQLAGVLLDAGHYPRFATHDHRLIAAIRRMAETRQLAPSQYEFQMLYGVRTPLQQELVAAGYRVCVYVPYGDEWYPYLMRRLAERPRNLELLLRALVTRRER